MLQFHWYLVIHGFGNMEMLIEQIVIYSLAALLCLLVIVIYLFQKKRKSKIVSEKIKKAHELGLYEPISLHPVVDEGSCIQTGACISACPEKDILGIQNGKATTINASQCIGHGACFHACPTEAISLCIGTEKRGVELPHVSPEFETNIPGIYIAGELGGMGLIKNAVEQGKQAVENLSSKINKKHDAEYDLLIVGAGPAGIAASLAARKRKLKAIAVEQNSIGGTVFTFPRAKVVMTTPMNIPLYGSVKLFETSKTELLGLWQSLIDQFDIPIVQNTKVEAIERQNGHFIVTSNTGNTFTAHKILLTIGRRGSPRKLNIKGEKIEKVAYRLLEPEKIADKNILVVGGGDSAIESALLLADSNRVVISYRSEVFKRLKPKNNEKILQAVTEGKLKIFYNSQPIEFSKTDIKIKMNNEEVVTLDNDLVYIFAGGELPTDFLKKIGLEITKKHGEALLKHK